MDVFFPVLFPDKPFAMYPHNPLYWIYVSASDFNYMMLMADEGAFDLYDWHFYQITKILFFGAAWLDSLPD